MRIAFISYECPPDTGGAGIGTYVEEAATMLANRGHFIEVFAGSGIKEGSEEKIRNLVVHWSKVGDRREFSVAAGQAFLKRHTDQSFDVLEGPDLLAEAGEACRLAPDVPSVVRLHSGLQLLQATSVRTLSLARRFRIWAGAKRRGEHPFWSVRHSNHAAEVEHSRNADLVAAPSNAIARRVVKDWRLDKAIVRHLPNPFSPSREYLDIRPGRREPVVTFIGRVDVLKGVLDLVRAVPRIVAVHPKVRFQFVGRVVEYSPVPGLTMQAYLTKVLGRYAPYVEFSGAVPRSDLPGILAHSAVFTLPSLWESFSYVCLEAMAAACPVVGTKRTGIEEILDFGKVGRTVRAGAASELAMAINDLLSNEALRQDMGEAGRQRVLSEYNHKILAPQYEAFYQEAISRRGLVGCRRSGTHAI